MLVPVTAVPLMLSEAAFVVVQFSVVLVPLVMVMLLVPLAVVKLPMEGLPTTVMVTVWVTLVPSEPAAVSV